MLSEEGRGVFSPAGLKTGDGLLCFSTLKGVAVVDLITPVSAPAPAVVLEQTLVDGVPERPVLGRANSGPDARRIEGEEPVESLRLAPGKHTLEFRYTGLSFDAPERVRFRYRLEGLDPDWVEAGNRRGAFHSFVPPGHYHFWGIACNRDRAWNEESAGLLLPVLP